MTTIIGTGEVGALHSREELEEMQRLPLQRKIQITTARIIEWYQHYDGKVYVAFSGGKDSTVLLDIVRRIYPDVPAVFSDTGLEFPEVREFVKSCENVTIVRPEMNFRKVIEVYGYPVVSKRVANTVEYGHKPGSFRWKELHGEIMRSNGTPSEFNCKKWCYLLDGISVRCFGNIIPTVKLSLLIWFREMIGSDVVLLAGWISSLRTIPKNSTTSSRTLRSLWRKSSLRKLWRYPLAR